jgi:hypothetical protein
MPRNMKTKLKTILQLVILFLFAGLFACKNDCPEYHVAPEAISYGVFKVGSWWIYQDETTGVQDCVYVDKITTVHNEVRIDKKCDYVNEQISMILKSKKSNIQFGCGVYRSRDYSGISISFNNCFLHSATVATFSPNLVLESDLEYFNSATIGNITYNDVIKNTIISDYGMEIWFAKGVGLLKVSGTNDCKKFYLINSKIIPYE